MEEKNISFFRFEDLRVYNKAIDYSKWVIANLSNPRSDSEQTLQHSFVRSACDIAINIAEGSSRNKAQFEHYLKISKTAIRECLVFTTVAYELGILSQEQQEQSRVTLMEMTRMIGALIISLTRGARRRGGESSDDLGLGIDDVDTDISTDFPDLDR